MPRPAEPFVVLTEYREPAFDLEGERGSIGDLSLREATALCWSHHRYRENMAVGPDVLILDDDGFLRSAELLAGAYRDDAVAAAEAELIGTQLGDWRASAIMPRLEGDDKWSEAELDRARSYLADRAEDPSDRAADEFVVFEVSSTMTSRYVVRMRVGEIVNSDAERNRNTAIYAQVLSPNREVALLLDRDRMNDVCGTIQ